MNSPLPNQPSTCSRALFVDDDTNLLTSTKRILRGLSMLGLEMTFHENPLAAEVIVEHTPTDLMITDMQMPGIDGAQLIHRLRGVAHFPVVYILTGQADESSLARAFGYAHRVIRKPCAVDRLRAICEGFQNACEIIPNRNDRSRILKQLVIFIRTGIPEPFLTALRSNNRANLAALAATDRRSHFFARYIAAYFGLTSGSSCDMSSITDRFTSEINMQVQMAVTSECREAEHVSEEVVSLTFVEPFMKHLEGYTKCSSQQVQDFLLTIWGQH